MAKTSKSINYNQFKIEKLNQENIQLAISKAQAYVKGKALLSTLFGGDTFTKAVNGKIETFEEALEHQGIDKAEFEASCKGLEKDEIAYKKIKIIARALNNGWTPDWDNDNEYKHYPYFNMQSGVGFSRSICATWLTITSVGSHLCFKSSDLAIYAGKQFESIYKDFLTL